MAEKLSREQLLDICEAMTSEPEELIKFCGLLMRLSPEVRQEICFMIKGAALVAKNQS